MTVSAPRLALDRLSAGALGEALTSRALTSFTALRVDPTRSLAAPSLVDDALLPSLERVADLPSTNDDVSLDEAVRSTRAAGALVPRPVGPTVRSRLTVVPPTSPTSPTTTPVPRLPGQLRTGDRSITAPMTPTRPREKDAAGRVPAGRVLPDAEAADLPVIERSTTTAPRWLSRPTDLSNSPAGRQPGSLDRPDVARLAPDANGLSPGPVNTTVAGRSSALMRATTDAMSEVTTAVVSQHVSAATTVAGQRVVALLPSIDRLTLDAMRRSPALDAADGAPVRPSTSVAPLDAQPARSRDQAATPTEGNEVVGRRTVRPRGLADLASMFPAADARGSQDDSRRAPRMDPYVARTENEMAGTEPALVVASDVTPITGFPISRPSVSSVRTAPSPAVDLSGAAAVMEAVLLHEARRYGLSVEES